MTLDLVTGRVDGAHPASVEAETDAGEFHGSAGFEGGTVALGCALQGIRPDRLVFATDYPQDFTGVSTDTGKGMTPLRDYIDAIRGLPLSDTEKDAIMGETAAELLGLSS